MCWVALIPVAMAAYSAYSQSQSAKEQGQYQAKVAQNNAQVAEWQAADAKERGDTAAANVRRKYASLEGTQVASLAARGIDVSEGSANALLTDTSFFSDVDQRTTKANAAREAWGYQTQANNFASNAQFYQAGADAQNPLLSGALAGTAAYFGGGGKTGLNSSGSAGSSTTLLSSSTTVNPKWYGSGFNGSAGVASMGAFS